MIINDLITLFRIRGTNTRQGRGKMVFPSGQILEGWFKNNELNGKGRMIYKTGIVYTGMCVNG